MTPAKAIDMLDRQLAKHGEDIVLRRVVDGGANIDVICRARVDTLDNEKISAALRGSDVHLIISPTQIIKAGWPDGNPAHRVPVENGDDKIILAGDPPRTIAYVDPQSINGDVVRINLRITA